MPTVRDIAGFTRPVAGRLRGRGQSGLRGRRGLCYQDYVAVGVILELFRRGLNVPRDVAVVGCDDLPIGHSFALGVSSYSYPSEAIARAALRVMANRIAHPADPLTKVLAPGQLVVRDSTVVN